MSKWLGALLFSVTPVLGSLPLLWAAETEDDQSRPPVIAIGLQVVTPQGGARTFRCARDQTPAQWNQTFPVVQGDKLKSPPRLTPRERLSATCACGWTTRCSLRRP